MSETRRLAPSLVLVTDVLGYKSYVLEHHRNGTSEIGLNTFALAFESALKDVRDRDDSNWTVKAFSDNIYLQVENARLRFSANDAEGLTGSLFYTGSLFQLQMIASGFFIRGAITIGQSFTNDNLIFGKPVIEAHYLESKIAKYPRIILSESAKRLAARHLAYYDFNPHAPQFSALLEDTDGHWFIHYLYDLVHDWEDGTAIFDEDALINHKKSLETGFDAARDEAVKGKFDWLISYHNFFCSQIGEDKLAIKRPISSKPPQQLSVSTIHKYYAEFQARRRGRPDDPGLVFDIAAQD